MDNQTLNISGEDVQCFFLLNTEISDLAVERPLVVTAAFL